MDVDGRGEIEFETFNTWYMQYKEEQRRHLRRKVRDWFQAMDDDGNGFLDKHEMSLLFKKVKGEMKLLDPCA
jgi:Ca2+-binding EF-hand superfamily protein|eukprot:COSAG06_NODE_1641_length_8829_cov_23.966667_4_plen_72_part_00